MWDYMLLTPEQRYQVQSLMKAGYNQTVMASIVDVHKSMISREFSHNQGLHDYWPIGPITSIIGKESAHYETIAEQKRSHYILGSPTSLFSLSLANALLYILGPLYFSPGKTNQVTACSNFYTSTRCCSTSRDVAIPSCLSVTPS